MTNKPMLSVERELLERALSAIIVARGQGSPTERDLRAILDNPSECRCKRYGKDNPHWPCPVHAEPASQHQGEPVALQHMAVSEGGVLRWMTGRKMQDCELYAMPDGSAIRSKLFAEPPAPVAVVMPERMDAAPFTTIDRGSKNYKAGYNAALTEVARLNGVKP